jgi:hypothetical protein
MQYTYPLKHKLTGKHENHKTVDVTTATDQYRTRHCIDCNETYHPSKIVTSSNGSITIHEQVPILIGGYLDDDNHDVLIAQ